MGVFLRHCLANLCDDPTDPQPPPTGFAMITLKSQVDVTWAHDTVNNVSYPVAEGSEFVVEAQIDPVTGCWQTPCELPCNSDLTPAGTYYEVVEVINGAACGPAEFVQFDCANVAYANPTLLPDVSLSNPSPAGVNAITQLIADNLAFQFVDIPGLTLTEAGVGVAGDPLIVTPAFQLDPDANNALTITANGLLVNVPDQVVVAPDAAGVVNRLTETAAGLLVDLLVDVDDTETLNLALNGAGSTADPWIITGDVVVDPDPANMLVANAAGLFVPSAGFLGATDTDTIQLVLGGSGTAADPHALTANAILNPDPNNALTQSALGLFVAENLVVDGSTASINSTVTGTGTTIDPWVVTGDVIIEGTSGDNILVQTIDGLRVPSYNLQIADTTSINTSLIGVGTAANPWIVSSELRLDPASTATIAITADGLRVNETQRDNGLILAEGDGLVGNVTGTGTDVDPWLVTLNLDLEGTSGLVANPTGLSVLVDPASTSDISLSAAGLRIDETPLLLTANGSNLAITQGGVAGHVANIITLSGDAGNVLSAGSDGGIYIDAPTISAFLGSDVFLNNSAFDAATNILTLDLSDGNSYPIDLSGLVQSYALQVTDSTSVNLTLTGDGSTGTPWDITATVETAPGGGLNAGLTGLEIAVDPASTAVVTVGAGGLRVDQTPVILTTDGNATGVAQGGVADHTIDIRLLSAVAGNALGLGADGGLWLDITAFDIGNVAPLDTAWIDTTITGTGAAATPWTVSSIPILSPDGDNVATLAANGIKAVSFERLTWSTAVFAPAVNPLGSYIFADGSLVDAAIVAATAPVGGTETWELRVNGALASTGVLAAGATTATFPAVDFPIAVGDGDVVTCAPAGAAPPTPSTMTTVSARMTGGI